MVFQQRTNRDGRRRGVILLVVLALLTLFAIVGISFVLYADSEAASARINKEAEMAFQPNIDAELALSMFLGQLIYDVPDDATGVYSAMRGNSLARSMYGWNSSGLNDKPFTGTGRLHYSPTTPIQGASGYAIDDGYLVNFTYFSSDSFLRDPERYGSRAGLTNPQGPYAGGFNVPYTYPDHQNMFLAMMRATDGMILTPSFHRSWLFDPTNQGYPNAPNWQAANPAGRYLTCIVRPADMGTGFPTPDANGLSVKNLEWGPGSYDRGRPTTNDSPWIDINAPVMTASNGQKYKMLVAPLILELDSRINLNVVGNMLLGPNSYNGHTSHEGWGAFEINPSKVLNSPGTNSNGSLEWTNIFLGNPNAQPGGSSARVYGRYGFGRYPTGPALKAGTAPRLYAPVDFNGCLDPSPNSPTTTFLFPQTPAVTTPVTAVPYQCFPSFTPGYGNGVPVETTDKNGNPNHPLMFNAQRPAADNRLLALPSLAALLRYGGSNSEALTSDLLQLCPQNFIFDNSNGGIPLKRRNLVTLLSADLDRPGAIPYIWNANDQTNPNPTRYGAQFTPQVTAATGLWSPLAPLQPNPITFPTPANPLPTTPPANSGYSEFDPATWRSTLGQQLRVDLNRTLTSYPAPYQAPFTIGTTAPNTTRFTNMTQFQQAVADRQQLASDIFAALQKATGALPLSMATQGSPDYNALRWLAQLAVNIVDFIDQDDINTPFRWDPNNTNAGDYGYVFGTELPRLVINEAFIQLDNDPNDPGVKGGTMATTHYNVNTWVELYNPFPNEGANAPASDSANQAVLDDGQDPNKYSIYQLAIADPTQPPNGAPANIRLANMRNPANVLGDPNYGVAMGTSNIMTYGAAPGTPSIVNGFYKDPTSTNPNGWITTPPPAQTPNPQQAVMPLWPLAANNNNGYNDPGYPNGTNQGFYVIGPPPANSVANPTLPTTTTSSAMTYWVNLETANPNPGSVPPVTTKQSPPPAPTILLQRLACPGLPAQTDPSKDSSTTPYNPYITVDYYEAFGQGQVYDSRKFNAAGANVPNAFQPLKSWGRSEPYAATNGPTNSQWNQQSQIPAPAPVANHPSNTFYRQNGGDEPVPNQPFPNPLPNPNGLKIPFDWLAHLDRQLISPMELLHVSAFKPHELTQQFYDPNTGNSFNHYAPWTNPQSRLYRFFELVETASRAAGVSRGGRIPGKININMIFDEETFQAICDAQVGNWFASATDVKNLFSTLVKQRSPTPDNYGTATLVIGQMPGAPAYPAGVTPSFQADKPFWSLTTGFANGGDALDPNFIINSGTQAQRGIGNTILGNSAMLNPFAVTPPPGHPYQLNQLATKIFNHLTTRSNVFAVWMTVGFFEVAKDSSGNYIGDQSLPVKLGAEIGSAEGRQLRHRMFAIVDRTNLQVFSTTCSTAIAAATAPYSPQTVTLGTLTPTNPNGTVPSLQAGMVLVFDPNTDNEETVVVQRSPGANQISAIFQRSHASGAQVIQRGNPGPWMTSQPNMMRYDPRRDPLVVPYFALIE